MHKRMSVYNLQRFAYNLQSFSNVSFDIGFLSFISDIHLLVIIHMANLYINIISLMNRL